jgi:hypothetical protein
MHEGEENAYRIFMGKPEEKRFYLDIGGRIVLKWIIERWDRVV